MKNDRGLNRFDSFVEKLPARSYCQNNSTILVGPFLEWDNWYPELSNDLLHSLRDGRGSDFLHLAGQGGEGQGKKYMG